MHWGIVSRICRTACRAALPGILALLWSAASPDLAAARCAGDCSEEGAVTVDEIVTMVSIAMGLASIEECPAGDLRGIGTIAIDDIIAAVRNAQNGCPATPTATLANTPLPTPTPTPANGSVAVGVAVARDAQGIALRLGEVLTTEGVVTVGAGTFANRKLKVFAQDGPNGVMLYHGNSAEVDAFQVGDRVRGTGMIRQEDPTSDDNPARGTVMLDLTGRSWRIVSSGNPLPLPQDVTLAELVAGGIPYVGEVVRVAGLRKVAGTWPSVGGRSTQVTVSDDGGRTQIPLRIQRATLATPALPDALAAIGEGAFTLTGIVVQDDPASSGALVGGFEIWLRGASDVSAE